MSLTGYEFVRASETSAAIPRRPPVEIGTSRKLRRVILYCGIAGRSLPEERISLRFGLIVLSEDTRDPYVSKRPIRLDLGPRVQIVLSRSHQFNPMSSLQDTKMQRNDREIDLQKPAIR